MDWPSFWWGVLAGAGGMLIVLIVVVVWFSRLMNGFVPFR